MCGISGLFNPGGLNGEAESSLIRMISELGHRGPDDTGLYIDDYAALGQSRLSIIDLTGGAQPMTNENSTLWIVFNGEIFNYPELRTELLNKGHRFKTDSDTEVLLHLYEEKREKCLDDLNGQFAFAIWDTVKEELFLARDRAGILPIYYSANPDGSIVFASEIKAIFAGGTTQRKINYKALTQIFTFWTTLPGETFFENIKELPPANYMRISKREFYLNQYWNLRFEDTAPEMNFRITEIAEQAKSILHDAVRIRLRADVPVGCYLSGGIDSSGVTSLIKNNFNNDLRTFGITFEDQNFNEKHYQQAVVSHLKVNHTEQYVSNSDISEYFTEIVYNTEKPILRTAPVPLYLLSKKVREEGYKVVLSGEGADEVFGGYNIFKEALIRKFWSDYPGSASRHLLLSRLYPYIFKDSRLRSSITEFFRKGIENPSNPFFSHQIRWNNTSKTLNFISQDLLADKGMDNLLKDAEKIIPPDFSSWSTLGKAQYLEFRLFMSGYLLSSQGDRMAMGHSVELRVPYLDHRLIEFMSKIPASLKIRGLNEKFILKKVFEKDLPKQVVNRAKNPFRAPINYLFANSSKNMDFVSPGALKESGLFDSNKVQLLVKKLNNGSGGEVDNMAAAGILSAQAVYYKFIKDFIPAASTPVYINNYFDYRKKLENSI